MTKYRTIVADPPWHYDRTGLNVHGERIVNTGLPYESMALSEIEALPVGDWAEPDAHLYLWTTQKYLESAFAVARWWGFDPRNLLVWSKSPRGIGSPHQAFVNSTEFVVYARRGSLLPLTTHLGTVFTWPRGEHSAKPDGFLDLVEQVSPGPYLEMFARRARMGWDYWGNESLNTAEVAV